MRAKVGAAIGCHVTMNYLEGGKREIWTFHREGQKVAIEVPAMTTAEQIIEKARAAHA